LHDRNAEEKRADGHDRSVQARPPGGDGGEGEEERKDHEPEARQREERPALARHAQRQEQAQRGEEAVGRAEPAPGCDRQSGEEQQAQERGQVHHRGVQRLCVSDRPVDPAVRPGHDLPHPGPRGPRSVPDALQRPEPGQPAVPGVLRVQERPRLADLLPEQERVGGEQRRRDGETRQAAAPVARVPRKQHQRGEQREPERPGQQRQPGYAARFEPPSALREQEGPHGQQQEERLAVHGAEEERHREDGDIEHGPPRAVRTEPLLCQPEEQRERAGACCHRDRQPRQHEVPAEHAAETRHECRIEREERRCLIRVGRVPVLGDAHEPGAVPACPDVHEPADVVHPAAVPDHGERRRLGLEPEQCEDERPPERDAAPREDLERRARAPGRARRDRRHAALA
jgi:hypothetical protein